MKPIAPLSLISIITPVLNNARDIEACLKSVAKQSYALKEHWVIDGGSTDGTLEIIKHYATQYDHIKWISENDNGVYDAMNKGINLSTGKWLYFLGSDDVLVNNTVIEDVFNSVDIEQYDMLYGKIQLKENGSILGEPMDINKLKFINTHHQATFIKKTVFNKLGKYNTKYSVCADWAFTIKCFQSDNLKKEFINKVVAVYTTTGISNTAKIRNHNPRLIDKDFNKDFINLFEYFSLTEKVKLYLNDFLPKYLNPKAYINYFRKITKVYFKKFVIILFMY